LKTGLEEASKTEVMSTTYAQNERHIQDSDIIHIDSEGQGAGTPDRPQQAARNVAEKDQGVSLGQVLSTCKEHQSFFPEPLRNWADVERISDKIAPMLGIDQPVMIDAKRMMGRQAAAITILCMLEKANAIRSPGAYLRRLTQMAMDGAFSLKPMVMALENREIVS
jgi:replication initiation protein RepC